MDHGFIRLCHTGTTPDGIKEEEPSPRQRAQEDHKLEVKAKVEQAVSTSRRYAFSELVDVGLRGTSDHDPLPPPLQGFTRKDVQESANDSVDLHSESKPASSVVAASTVSGGLEAQPLFHHPLMRRVLP
ncbi:hypothetical protein ACA910_000612 [Epithemia clementina (nom. ined.)]